MFSSVISYLLSLFLFNISQSLSIDCTYPNLGHSGHEVTTGGLELVDDGVGGQGPHAGDALHVLVGEVGLALLFALGQGHVEGLGAHDAPVHLRHSLGGLLRRGEADEAESLGAALLQHDLKHRDTRQTGCYM